MLGRELGISHIDAIPLSYDLEIAHAVERLVEASGIRKCYLSAFYAGVESS